MNISNSESRSDPTPGRWPIPWKTMVEMVSPVVDLRHMRFLEGVLDGQGMKVEGIAKQGFNGPGRIPFGALDVQPKHAEGVLNCFLNPLGRPVEMELAGTRPIDASEYRNRTGSSPIFRDRHRARTHGLESAFPDVVVREL